jgi:hypothetical protein
MFLQLRAYYIKNMNGGCSVNYAENINYLNDQLNQTQYWLENQDLDENPFVVNMIIKGMIETEKQIEYFEGLEKTRVQ